MNLNKFAVVVLCLMVAPTAFPVAAQEKPVVIIETSLGDITVELNADPACLTLVSPPRMIEILRLQANPEGRTPA